MQVNGKTFTIGADPEVFMGKGTQFVSAHGAVPGDKLNPTKVENGAVQVDGMALEFNIDPAHSFEEFDNNLTSVQNTLKGMIGDHNFIEDVSVFFDEEFTKDIPAENLMLGCSADFNGWTMQETPKPDGEALMRTAGGHVHVGGFFTSSPFQYPHYDHCGRLARLLDETLGVYSILWDKDDKRRSMYGQAGCFRPKKYGMEYRTLSNAWIFQPKLRLFVYESVKEALSLMFSNYEPDEEIQHIINNSDRKNKFFYNNPKVDLLGL